MLDDFSKNFFSEEDLRACGSQMAKLVDDRFIIFLNGPLGAGKTTFVRGFLQGLGYEGKVKSPTYTLVEPYEIGEKIIFHFDFYRVKNPNEVELIGIHDYFSQPAICLIEWPDKAFPLLPQPDIDCYIELSEEGRHVLMHSHSDKGKNVLSQMG